MDKVIEILEKYSQPKIVTVLLAILIISHLLLWGCVLDIGDEQLRRTGVIDMARDQILHSK